MCWLKSTLWCLLLALLLKPCMPSIDPVAVFCEPLCQYEMERERMCALTRGCYDLKDDDELFIECWKPCWNKDPSCLSMCREQHSSIKQMCYNECKNSADVICPGFCFAKALDILVYGPPQTTPGMPVNPPGTQVTAGPPGTQVTASPPGIQVTASPPGIQVTTNPSDWQEADGIPASTSQRPTIKPQGLTTTPLGSSTNAEGSSTFPQQSSTTPQGP